MYQKLLHIHPGARGHGNSAEGSTRGHQPLFAVPSYLGHETGKGEARQRVPACSSTGQLGGSTCQGPMPAAAGCQHHSAAEPATPPPARLPAPAPRDQPAAGPDSQSSVRPSLAATPAHCAWGLCAQWRGKQASAAGWEISNPQCCDCCSGTQG